MERSAIRLRILELALDHGLSTDKIGVAEDFAEFVFDNEPARMRDAGIAGVTLKGAKLKRGKKRR